MKNRAYLIVLDRKILQQTLQVIDFEKLTVDGIIMDYGIQIKVGEKVIPLYSFAEIDIVLRKKENFCLLVGYEYHMRELGQMAKILHVMGVDKDRIVNFTIYFSTSYWGNLKYAASCEKLDFFATGISYMEVGIAIEDFGGSVGVNLSSTGQDLYYGYQTARFVLNRRPVKYCLIGLSPYSFLYDIRHSFSANFYQLQYDIVGFPQNDDNAANFTFEVMQKDFKRQFDYIQADKDADPNYMNLKQSICQTMTGKKLWTLAQELEDVSGVFDQEVMEKNIEILQQYLFLCHEKSVRPICVVLPFSPILHDSYPAEKLILFRSTLHALLNQEKDMLIDLFDEHLGYECFYDLTHLNQKGAAVISRMIASYIPA